MDTPNQSPEPDAPLSADALSSLSFAPDWVRRTPGETPILVRNDDRGNEVRRPPRDRRRDDGGRRDARGPGSVRPPIRRGGPPREGRDRPPDDSRGGGRDAERGLRSGGIPDHLRISFLPEQRALSALLRELTTLRQAMPLRDVARRLLSSPDQLCVKIEVHESAPEGLHQCKVCHGVAGKDWMMAQHLVARHLLDHFTVEDAEGEAPTGSFTSVARCDRSGVLLGPANHHAYGETLLEVHHMRYPGLSAEEYRRTISQVREPAEIERWKEEQKKHKVYKLKDPKPGAPESFRWVQAESYFLANIAPGLSESTRRAIVPVTTALRTDDRELMSALMSASRRETAAPRSLVGALRPALRHRKCHFFAGPGGYEYVTAVEPTPLTAESVTVAVATALRHLEAAGQPVTRAALLESLAAESIAAADAAGALTFLVDRGHLIHFSNGTLALPPRRASAPAAPAAPIEAPPPADGTT